MILSLNPDYYLKWDVKRIILYSKTQCHHNSSNEWISFIHPLHAFIIGVLSMEHDTEKAIATIQKHITIENQFIENFIFNLTENPDPHHITSTKGYAAFPKNLLLKGNLLHMQHNIQEIIQKCLVMNDIDLKTPRLFHSPIKITWMLNNKCAVHCNYCYADTLHKCHEISFEKFQEVIEECRKENMQGCEIIGGDFFVKRNWNKFLTCLIRNGFSPSFISTKKNLTKEELELLIKINYSGILQFSLDSFSQHEIESILHCSSEYLDKVKNMFLYLSILKGLPFKVRISTVLTQANANIKTIQDMYSFFSSLKLITEWEIRFAMPSFEQSNNFLCTNTQIDEITEYIHNLKINSFIPISFVEYNQTNPHTQCFLAESGNHDYRCSANMRHCFILPDGKITLCERLYWNPNFIIGDLNTMTLPEIWNSSKAMQLAFDMEQYISKQSICFTCKGKELCFSKHKRCWVNVVNKWGTNNITYPDPLCIKSNN